MNLQPFNPKYGSGATVAPGAASATAALVTNQSSGEGNKNVLLTNTGTVVVYVRIGPSTVTATTADYPVLPNTQVTITKFQDDTHIAYITDGVAGSLNYMLGEGF